MRIGLVGCVKEKRSETAPAHDLYTSALFRGRRRYVVATCDRWYVLSALHGLVHPTTLLEPYDVTLTNQGVAARREWARRVLAQIDAEVGSVSGIVFEMHAGATYRDFGLVDGLAARGATVVTPARGLTQGQQLAFYKKGPQSPCGL